MAKLRIAYVMPSMARGGAERFLLDLISEIKDEAEIKVILFKDGGAFLSQLSELAAVEVLTKKGTVDIANVFAIAKSIKNFRADIVHTQLGGDIRGRIAAKMAGVKIIVSTEQNTNIGEGFMRRAAKALSSTLADKIVAISKAVASDMTRRYLIPRSKQLIIPNGIILSRFPYSERTPRKPAIIGAMGRLNEQKGFDILIKAWQSLKPDAKLLIAGTGPQEAMLKDLATAEIKEGKIEFMGDIAQPESFLSSLDLFTMPSRWEGLGIAALEAGASGAGIVASQVGGLAEFVNDQTGYPAIPEDKESLRSAIKRALTDLQAGRLATKTAALRKQIEDHYSMKSVGREYLKLYEKLYEDTTSK
ncbi:MAG: glycosyltransferase [Bacillota bacterium]